MSTSRDFDIIVWGATGYTGRLVAEYLLRASPPGVRWALAGRDAEKLRAVRAELAGASAAGAELAVLTADAGDRASLSSLASRTRVMCTTVGPYGLYGTPLVAACVEHGTHYCDLNGEVVWSKEVIATYHRAAMERGARIVLSCGFDSIPSDLGVFLLSEHVRATYGQPLAAATLRVRRLRGGLSGGTAASMLEWLKLLREPSQRRIAADPYALYPEGVDRGLDRNERLRPSRDPALGRWSGPFVMAGINTRVVRRSNALLGFPYGAGFRYAEVVDTGAGLRGLARAAGLSAGLSAVVLAGATVPGSALLTRLMPRPGQGPSAAQRQAGSFHLEIYGQTAGDPVRYARVIVQGQQDPGYGETAKMLGETALCLATDDLTSPGGVQTPAAAMGAVLLERLRRAGMVFRAESV